MSQDYLAGVQAGLQKALDLVNGNYDAWEQEGTNDVVELIARIITDIQVAGI